MFVKCEKGGKEVENIVLIFYRKVQYYDLKLMSREILILYIKTSIVLVICNN